MDKPTNADINDAIEHAGKSQTEASNKAPERCPKCGGAWATYESLNGTCISMTQSLGIASDGQGMADSFYYRCIQCKEFSLIAEVPVTYGAMKQVFNALNALDKGKPATPAPTKEQKEQSMKRLWDGIKERTGFDIDKVK